MSYTVLHKYPSATAPAKSCHPRSLGTSPHSLLQPAGPKAGAPGGPGTIFAAAAVGVRPRKFCKIFQILRHIKSLDTCMKH
jgi:hypothetical protein